MATEQFKFQRNIIYTYLHYVHLKLGSNHDISWNIISQQIGKSHHHWGLLQRHRSEKGSWLRGMMVQYMIKIKHEHVSSNWCPSDFINDLESRPHLDKGLRYLWSTYLATDLPIYLSTYLPIIYLSTYLSIYLPIYLSLYIYIEML
jgi:hypothetical protein